MQCPSYSPHDRSEKDIQCQTPTNYDHCHSCKRNFVLTKQEKGQLESESHVTNQCAQKDIKRNSKIDNRKRNKCFNLSARITVQTKINANSYDNKALYPAFVSFMLHAFVKPNKFLICVITSCEDR